MLEILNAYAVPSLLILLLALLRACFGRKIPRKFFHILWTAAALRFLIPITVGLPLRPYEAPEEKAVFLSELTADETSREFTVCESPGAFGTSLENILSEKIFTIIYIVGAAAIALYFCIGHIKTINRCKISLPFQTEANDLKAALNLRRNVDIRTCENTVSPFTYGIFRPVIILPGGIYGEGLRYILGHELVHIKRMDVLKKLLFAIALCIHWTNPAVWLLYALAQRDMEITCDEEAVKRFSFSPRSYALTLIEMEERLLPATAAAFGKKPVRERIERLAQLGKTPSVMGAAAGFMAVIVAAAFFTAVEHMPPRVVYITADTASVSDIAHYGEELSYAGEEWSYAAAESSYAVEETAAVFPPITTVTLSDGVTLYEIKTSDLSEDELWELETSVNNAFDTAMTPVWDSISYIFNPDNTAAVMTEAAAETTYYGYEYVISVSADNIAEDIYADKSAGELAIAISDDTVVEDNE
ncbi:MAG: M56 family metallopeptidase [Oscillospiraceae bacterium]|nr:M56 family metallopeptidase [Oscillospiraceae bacterium]